MYWCINCLVATSFVYIELYVYVDFLAISGSCHIYIFTICFIIKWYWQCKCGRGFMSNFVKIQWKVRASGRCIVLLPWHLEHASTSTQISVMLYVQWLSVWS